MAIVDFLINVQDFHWFNANLSYSSTLWINDFNHCQCSAVIFNDQYFYHMQGLAWRRATGADLEGLGTHGGDRLALQVEACLEVLNGYGRSLFAAWKAEVVNRRLTILQGFADYNR